MRLYCLRHGLTIENTKGIYHGTSDGTLTDEQRAALANVRFDASRYDAITCAGDDSLNVSGSTNQA